MPSPTVVLVLTSVPTVLAFVAPVEEFAESEDDEGDAVKNATRPHTEEAEVSTDA